MHRPTRRLRPALIAVLLALAPSWEPAESGGVPDKLPTDWVAVGPGPGAEIVQYIQSLPHDPNPLGVATAHLANKAYPQSFSAFRFSSLDGTPLAGRWIVAVLDVSTLKPGKLVATAWVDKPGILRQQVTLEKK